MKITVYIVDEDTKETLYSFNDSNNCHKGGNYKELTEIAELLKIASSAISGYKQDLIDFTFQEIKTKHSHYLMDDIRRQYIKDHPLENTQVEIPGFVLKN